MILITGASSGIGEATARAFAKEAREKGEKRGLILLARRKDRLEKLAAELTTKHGVKALAFAVDVSDPQALEDFSRRAPLAEVEVLINNAGLARGAKPIQDVTPAEWNEMIDVNLKGLLSVTHLVLPHLLARGRGHIVNLGSVAGQITYPNGNIYCATKAAVRAINEALRVDLLGKNIRVTEIAPGMVETEFSEVRFGDREKAKKVYAGMTPLTAQDIAEAIVWSVNRPPHMNVQQMMLYPVEQASPTLVHRRS